MRGDDHARTSHKNCIMSKKHMELKKEQCTIADCPHHCDIIEPNQSKLEQQKCQSYHRKLLRGGKIDKMWHCRAHMRFPAIPANLLRTSATIPDEHREPCTRRGCNFGHCMMTNANNINKRIAKIIIPN